LVNPKFIELYSTDEEILHGLKRNSDSAFSVLMRKYYSDLFRYGRHFTSDETIVADCIQDVFINVWENRHKTAPIRHLKPYLLTAIKRRILRVTSQNKQTRLATGNLEDEYDFGLEFSIEDVIVERQLDEERAARLRFILERLPARQKEVIYLIYYQQLHHQQVAEMMQINKQSVYNLLYESLQKIKAFWQEASALIFSLAVMFLASA
jgi:RNA polymerase sigma factor (sigma-70 family)